MFFPRPYIPSAEVLKRYKALFCPGATVSGQKTFFHSVASDYRTNRLSCRITTQR